MKEKKEFKDKSVNGRLNNVLKKDKQINPSFIKEVIKSDFFYLINNYFEVEFHDINLELDVDDNNAYDITINCKGSRIKMMRTIPDN